MEWRGEGRVRSVEWRGEGRGRSAEREGEKCGVEGEECRGEGEGKGEQGVQRGWGILCAQVTKAYTAETSCNQLLLTH